MDYYHKLITCPNCHGPHLSGSIESIGDGLYSCNNCLASFIGTVDSNKIFDSTINAYRGNIRKMEVADGRLWIPWRITLNAIERAYLNWVDEYPKGKFIVTWPWSSVRFIPVLVQKIRTVNPRARIVILEPINDIEEKPNESNLGRLTFRRALESLINTDTSSIPVLPDSLRIARNRFKSSLINKDTYTLVKILENGKRKTHQEWYRGEPNKVKKSVIKQVGELNGPDRIKKLTIVGKKPQPLNLESGDIEIELEEKEKRTGESNYNPNWFFNILLTPQNQLFFGGRSRAALEIDKIPQGDDVDVLLVDSQRSGPTLRDQLTKLSPDVLIIPDFDDFVKRDRFADIGDIRYLNTFSSLEIPLILGFSVNPEMRYHYNHGSMNLENFTVHTWDNDNVIERLPADNLTNADRDCPYSNGHWRINNGHEKIKEINFVYNKVLEMDKLNRVDEIAGILFNSVTDRLVKRMQSSPLPLNDRDDSIVFRRKHLNGKRYPYDTFFSIIANDLSEESRREVHSILGSVYGPRFNSNPLSEAVLKVADDKLQNCEAPIVIVVDTSDVRGFSSVVSRRFADSEKVGRVKVCRWADLNEFQTQQNDGSDFIIISTLAPNDQYSLLETRASEVVFVGSSGRCDTLKTIVTDRLYDLHLHPLVKVEEDRAPKELTTIISSINIPDEKELEDAKEEIVLSSRQVESASGRRDSRSNILKAGVRAYFITDGKGRCIILPLEGKVLEHTSGTLKETPTKVLFEELHIKKIGSASREIVVNKGNVYRSIKAPMVESMMNYYRDTRFKIPLGGTWNGFRDLYDSSTYWITCLKDAIAIISESSGKTIEEAAEDLAIELTKLDIVANSPETVKSWWSNFEVVSSVQGDFEVFDTERPKSRNDILTIIRHLNKLIKQRDFSEEEAERSAQASLLVQQIRHFLVKGGTNVSFVGREDILEELESVVKHIIRNADLFSVVSIDNVKLNEDAGSFVIYNERDHPSVKFSN